MTAQSGYAADTQRVQAGTFAGLASAAWTMGLDADQREALLVAAIEDVAALERIGEAELNGKWTEGWNAGYEAGHEAIVAANEKVAEVQENRASLLDFAGKLGDWNVSLTCKEARLKAEETVIANSRLDLERLRREVEGGTVRMCAGPNCHRPLSPRARIDARFCSGRCKTAARRARK